MTEKTNKGEVSIDINNFSLLTASCQYDTFFCMSKKRRTKRDKVIAELRRQVDLGSNPTGTYVYTAEEPTQKISVNLSQVSSSDYSYITSEIKKTLVVTTLIFALNLGFFLVGKNLNLRLPGF